jgi:hypothetical protein
MVLLLEWQRFTFWLTKGIVKSEIDRRDAEKKLRSGNIRLPDFLFLPFLNFDLNI